MYGDGFHLTVWHLHPTEMLKPKIHYTQHTHRRDLEYSKRAYTKAHTYTYMPEDTKVVGVT